MFNHMCSFCLTNSQHSKYYDQNKTFNSIIFNISVNYIIIHLASISLYLGCFVGYFWYFNYNLKKVMGILNYTEYL